MSHPDSLRRRFVSDVLVPHLVSPEPREAINLRIEFSRYLMESQYSRHRAVEIAEGELQALTKTLDRYMADWEEQGIPRPICETDQDDVFLTWSHKKFQAYSGLTESLDRNYCEVLQYLGDADPKQFLVLCGLWLRCVGCRTILVCDGPNDGGVDLLGVIPDGGLRSIVLVIQAKTSRHNIDAKTVLSDFNKYEWHRTQNTATFSRYRNALRVDDRIDGTAWVYLVLSNSAFGRGAQKIARSTGFLLRSARQMALVLRQQYTRETAEGVVDKLSQDVRADLSRNMWGGLAV